MLDLEPLLRFCHRYRMAIYYLFRKPIHGLMPVGFECSVEDPTPTITHGDVLHPCIRFIDKGFEGHYWWMVFTPFYGGDASMENPRLYYSDASSYDVPQKWTYYCTIKDRPSTGYNSDPTLLYEDGRLYVFFRENYTPNTKALGCSRATIGCYVNGGTVSYLDIPKLIEERRNIDKEVCPAFLPLRTGIRAYAFHIRFCSKMMYYLPRRLSWVLYRVLGMLKELCLYSRIQCRGVSIWESDSIEGAFSYKKTVKIKGVGLFDHPWHFDIFIAPSIKGKDTLFAVVQSDDKYADIRLARCEDGEHFHLYRNPLITSQTIGMNGIYKPTAVVIKGIFMLFYTARDNTDKLLNRLFVTTEKWTTVLNTLSD